MNILVTGGAGFIGSNLAHKLLSLGHKVSVLDNLDPYYPVILKEYNLSTLENKGLRRLYNCDILSKDDFNQAIKDCKPEVIFHLAAKAGVRNSVEHPSDYVDTNIVGTQTLLDLTRIHHVKKLMIASSSSVYGANTKVPFSESDEVISQVSPYASSKRAMEIICATYGKIYSVPMQLFRFFTVYGPSGRPDMAPVLFTKAMREGKTIQVFGSLTTQRDYTYIDDIVDGLIQALPIQDDFEIYNLGNNTPIQLKTFIDTIGRELHVQPKLKVTQKRAGDVDKTWADISKAKKRFGYAPKHSLEQGMKKFVSWYTDHAHLYQ